MGVVDGSATAAIDHYNLVRDNHDRIMESLQTEGPGETDDNDAPLLSQMEVEAIISEGLEIFFAEELQLVVRIPSAVHYMSNHSVKQPEKVAKVKQAVVSTPGQITPGS